jgi:outer membrane phospholipase A
MTPSPRIRRPKAALALLPVLLAGLAWLPGPLRSDAFDDALAENPLRAFHPNDVAIASDHGESRIRFLLSFQYSVAPFARDAFGLGPYRFDGLQFAYDGLYDFDAWSRRSQPIVSRLQNPGMFFAFRAPAAGRSWHLDGWDLGWFHESNGQVVDNRADYDALYAKVGQAATDSVSRGWDYWYLGSSFTWTAQNLRLRAAPTLRIFDGSEAVAYTPAEQDVFWRPGAPSTVIYDYDGLRAAFSAEWLLPHRALSYVSLEADLRSGYNSGHFAANWSKHLVLTLKAWYVPVFLYYDNGYGPFISDYSTWSQGWGIGITYWR